jgi:tetratricopeptide (TPR) repeat protein
MSHITGKSSGDASMPRDTDRYDFFVSYARADNREGWIEQFIKTLLAEHSRFSGGRELTYFFDKHDISGLSHWDSEIFQKGIARSRLFLAFLSPNYFASEVCRREWKAWIDQEIAKHILEDGSAPIYIIEVPGFLSKPRLKEHEVAREIARLCGMPSSDDRFESSVSPLVKEFRSRQVESVHPFYQAGLHALQRDDLKLKLQNLAKDIDERAHRVRNAAKSENTVPPYNSKFTGRYDELIELRRRLKDDRTGVICGIHGLGGIGKTELAYTYAHAYAGVYPGGRFLVRCEGESDLTRALLQMAGDPFHDEISDEERKQHKTHFHAVLRCLKKRLNDKRPLLLVLDNVTHLDLISRQQTDEVTVLGPQLHLLVTTRELPAAESGWLTLGELPRQEALDLLDKFRPITSDMDRAAAEEIVTKLGGFALALELVAAGLAAHKSATYASVATGLELDDLDTLAENRDVKLRRHNHEQRLGAVLGPTLAALKPDARRVMDFAAFMAPDLIPLSWLKELVTKEFPELSRAKKWGDPWEELIERLVRLGLLTRVDETKDSEIFRVHRLVQQLIKAKMTGDAMLMSIQTQTVVMKAMMSEFDLDLSDWQLAQRLWESFDAFARHCNESKALFRDACLLKVGQGWLHFAAWSRAEPFLRQALEIVESRSGPESSLVTEYLNSLAGLLHRTNRLEEAEQLMRRALAIEETVIEETDLEETDLEETSSAELINLALLLADTNRLEEAESLLKRALAIIEASLGPDHPEVATTLNNLAAVLLETSRLEEAESLLKRALTIEEESFGPNHPKVAPTLNNLAILLQKTNRLSEAEPLMWQTLQLFFKSHGPDHPDVATILGNLAAVLKETNRLKEAEPLMRQALAIHEKSLGPDHPDVANDINNLAQLLQRTNRLTDAEPLMRRALAIYEASYGPHHPSVAASLRNLALLLKDLNRSSEAETIIGRALVICLRLTQLSGEQHPQLMNTLGNCSLILRETGHSETETLLILSCLLKEHGVSLDHIAVQ